MTLYYASLVVRSLLLALDLDAPSAFGIPLGTLMLILFFWYMLKGGGIPKK